jgi:hypothetical protein
MATIEKGKGAVLTIHWLCDKGERADPDGQPGHIISLDQDSHLSLGHLCTEQGLQ